MWLLSHNQWGHSRSPKMRRSTLRMRALRANVKPAHCKFKGRTVSANFSPLLTQQTPVFFPQPTILALRRCQRLLNRSPYGHLHMKQQHAMRFYGESYAIATTAVLPSCQQFIECRVRSTVIKHTARHVAFWPQPVGSLPLAQNAWHCTSIHIYTYVLRGTRVMA